MAHGAGASNDEAYAALDDYFAEPLLPFAAGESTPPWDDSEPVLLPVAGAEELVLLPVADADEPVLLPAADDADHAVVRPTAPTVLVPTVAARGFSIRRAVLAVLLVLVGGTLAFAMLRSSASPAVPVTAAAVTPPRPKAPAPAQRPPTSPPALATAVAPVTMPAWNAANPEWLPNARKGVAFELPALKKVAIWQGLSQPMLIVRCEAGRMQAFVFTASALQMEAQDENHSVRIGFDGAPEVTERWADSSEHDALFAPDAIAFARRLTAARTLRFGYTPHNALPAVAEFQVSGLSDLVAPAAKSCGWK